MSLSAIRKTLRRRIFDRDAGRCRYCRLSQVGQAAVFHINHIVPRSKGGLTVETNLALQCPYCSFHKSDKTQAVDPQGRAEVTLFHPLRDEWQVHFAMERNGIIRGLTPTGHATAEALQMNDPLPLLARVIQINLKLLEPTQSTG